MKTVRIKSTENAVSLKTESRLLDALLAEQVPVKMLCGGRGLCATCHVYVTEGEESLTPMSQREKLSLGILTGAQANSRLSCQACVIGEGVEVALPEGLYIESFAELESLIGQRTLHSQAGEAIRPHERTGGYP